MTKNDAKVLANIIQDALFTWSETAPLEPMPGIIERIRFALAILFFPDWVRRAFRCKTADHLMTVINETLEKSL